MAGSGPSPKWFPPLPPRASVEARLFCLPHAGSGAAIFYRWRHLVPRAIEVVPVLLPGRESRVAEAPLAQIEDIVDALTRALTEHLDLPYALFGHSMGALLAYEWARGIQRAGLPAPTHLFLSGKEAAHLPRRPSTLHSLPDDELVAQLEQQFGPSSSAAILADPELRTLFLPTLRSDLKLVEAYRHHPGELLDCPITVLAGTEDRSVSFPGLTAWAELTHGPVTVTRLRGDHFYHVDPVDSRALIASVASTIKAGSPTSVP